MKFVGFLYMATVVAQLQCSVTTWKRSHYLFWHEMCVTQRIRSVWETLTMIRWSFSASLALVAVLGSSHAFAGVIVQNVSGPGTDVDNAFLGQSFTTPSGGPWDDITFNFFSNFPATTPTAAGTAFLLSQQYLGTPSNLSSSTPGFLGESTGITGGMYVFPTTLELQPGIQYFVFENGALPAHTGGNTIPGGQEYFTPFASLDFAAQGTSANFSVSGTVAAVPEPSTLVLLVPGLLGIGFLRRFRKSG
jgi:hypothetical protein